MNALINGWAMTGTGPFRRLDSSASVTSVNFRDRYLALGSYDVGPDSADNRSIDSDSLEKKTDENVAALEATAQELKAALRWQSRCPKWIAIRENIQARENEERKNFAKDSESRSV